MTEKVVYGFEELSGSVTDSFEFTAELAAQKMVALPDGRRGLRLTEGIVDGYCLKNFDKLLRMDSEEVAQHMETLKVLNQWDEEEEAAAWSSSPWPEEIVEYAELHGYSGVARPVTSVRRFTPGYPKYELLNILIFDQLDLVPFARWEVKYVEGGVMGRKVWPATDPWETFVSKDKIFKINKCPKEIPRALGRRKH